MLYIYALKYWKHILLDTFSARLEAISWKPRKCSTITLKFIKERS